MKTLVLTKSYNLLLAITVLPSVNIFTPIDYQVDCKSYALDMIEAVEHYFGCIDDATTYNYTYAQLVHLCESMDQ